MRYLYRCHCGMTLEHLQSIKDPLPSTLPCPKCDGAATYLIQGAPGIARSGESNPPLDVVIGKDAERRWSVIHERQSVRDKVRASTGSMGLTAVSSTEYQPVTGSQQKHRMQAQRAVEASGYPKPKLD